MLKIHEFERVNGVKQAGEGVCLRVPVTRRAEQLLFALNGFFSFKE